MTISLSFSGSQIASGERPFCFISCWLTDNRFPHIVKRSWTRDVTWSSAAASFRENVMVWNNQVFGDVFRRKRWLMRKLERINAKMKMSHDTFVDHLHRKLWQDYQRVLLQEEMIRRQKSRCMWVKHGDINTRFFHLSTRIWRKRNKIEVLASEDGDQITDPNALQRMTIDFFQALYTTQGSPSPLPSAGMFPSFTSHD